MNIYFFILGAVYSLFSPVSIASESRIYRNTDFQIVLPIPEGVFVCPNDAGVVDHGPMLALDGPTGSCVDTAPGRFIEVFASYPIEVKSVSLRSRLREQCREVGHRKCVSAPPDLGIKDVETLSAQVKHSDGHLDIFTVAERAPGASPSTLIEYSIRLHTTRKAVDTDLNVYRSILHTIEFSPGR